MPKIFRNNFNKCIFNDKYEITDVTIHNTNFKLHKPISYDNISMSIKYITLHDYPFYYNNKIFKFYIDDVMIICSIKTNNYDNYRGTNHIKNHLELDIRISDLWDDIDDICDFQQLNINVYRNTRPTIIYSNCNNQFDKIIYTSYLIDWISHLRQNSNEYVIVGDILMKKDEYKSLISIINNNFDEDYNICWVCRESCLDNEQMASCNHHIHTKCAIKIKQMREKNNKKTEYKCGVCSKKINCLSIYDKTLEEESYKHDTDSDNDE